MSCLVPTTRKDVVLQQKLAQAFAVFDKDGSGFISVNAESDFRKQMTCLGGSSRKAMSLASKV